MQRFLAAFVLMTAALCTTARADDTWATWDTSHVTTSAGTPVFMVEGKPYFVYGAAFFYERIPRTLWQRSLAQYKDLGINTIDLYVMWNWHEPREGAIDFTGETNARRDLDGLMRMIHEMGFKVILRPGPVIRNEWRNGGYPAYLLRRHEYDMPLHDVLEGRYPATATFQNAHADAAANEWLHNPTHLREAAAWLRTALLEVEPWSHDIIAIALDDDQGAYIDNDTWPAPNWHRYMRFLKTSVQRTAGRKVPLFINTFQMKVTASADVWAWGNWYQSDAYSIGDHDLSQLAFSTALLQTQSTRPVMASEFQAGWLQGADEIKPRPADWTNTTLALHEMLQLGVHGVVNFPVQDTVDPPGWEAPWANHEYNWDAALDLGANYHGARYMPTKLFGDLLREIPELATMHPMSDVAIAWLPSAYEPAAMTNARIAALADATIAQQQKCRFLALTCRFVDLRYANDADLYSARKLVVPSIGSPFAMIPQIQQRLQRLRRHGTTIARSVDTFARTIRANGGVQDAALLVDDRNGEAVFDAFNTGTDSRTVPETIAHAGSHAYAVPAFTIPARSAVDFVFQPGQPPKPIAPTVAGGPTFPGLVNSEEGHRGIVQVLSEDYFLDGTPTFVLQNDAVQAVISADAGARSFSFRALAAQYQAFTSIGAARDDVATPFPPSARDYIAQYTHPFAAGTFNRPYACTALENGPQRARLSCAYTAPDMAMEPVMFTKTFELDAGSRTLVVSTTANADAESISAVTTQSWLTIDCDKCTITAANGYRLVRDAIPANQTKTIRFTLQGPTPTTPNRP